MLVLFICVCFFVCSSSFDFQNLKKSTNFFESGTGDEYGYMLHFADVHFTDNYVEGGNPDCDQTKTGVCCVKKEGGQTRECGKFGFVDKNDHNNNWCDAPRTTFLAVADFIAQVPTIFDIKLSSIVYSGDIPDHGYGHTKDSTLGDFSFFYSEMGKRMKQLPYTRFFPVIGNHDSYPYGNFDFPHGSTWWLYDKFADLWAPFLSTEELGDVRTFGCYDALVEPGLRIVTINSNLVDPQNPKVQHATEEQKHMMATYLEDALHKAEANQEKVIISEHIAIRPDHSWVTGEWVADYQRIAHQYQHIIVADISGHYHNDFPQVRWLVKVQPAVRVFKYNKTTFEFLDYIQIYNELEKSNADGDMSKHWSVLYSALEEYSLKDFSPQSWYDFMESMTDDEDMFKKFEKNFQVDYRQTDWCTGNCKKDLLCSVKTNDHIKYDACMKKNGAD